MSPSPFELVTSPATVTLLMSKDCPNCAQVVEQIRELARRCPAVRTEIVDVFDAEAMRDRHGIQSVPATIIDDDLAIQGMVTARRLAEILASRGTPAYDTDKCRCLLDARRLDQAAAFLREPGRASSVLPILALGDLSDRMGVTLAVQTAHEAAPGSLSDLVPGLIDLLRSDNDSMRGDVADLLGTLGDPRAVEPLRKMLPDPNEDVVAAATDALQAIEGEMN